MKPVLCVRNDGDDTLGISALALERSGVPVVRLDGFESAVRFPSSTRLAELTSLHWSRRKGGW